jgi:hypothetical protein
MNPNKALCSNVKTEAQARMPQTLEKRIRDVRFTPRSRHAHRRRRCLLSANAGPFQFRHPLQRQLADEVGQPRNERLVDF